MNELENQLLQYLTEKRGFSNVSLSRLGGKSSNHLNFLLQTEGKKYVCRVSDPTGFNAENLTSITDEYTILKLVEPFGVGPAVHSVDPEGFSVPVLIEEFLEGEALKIVTFEKLSAVLRLMKKVENISLTEDQFPFRYSYRSYAASIHGWNRRLEDAKKLLPENDFWDTTLAAFKEVIHKASLVLAEHESSLEAQEPVFIYNDIHGENIIWSDTKEEPIFIDWQKVSRGDPAFMPAVFALAFESDGEFSREKLFSWVIKEYGTDQRLFHLRILEREVANMLWVVWAALKQKKEVPFKQVEEYDRYVRTRELVNNFSA
ncbi:MAG: hypothetical protein COV10_00630 [Candidatus Vogelbacteria bacterium CG10_big_fil_rev_8_21_14_0_10_51_16]|uniref:Aminoglycoside phosphotransferase domain-containing protein n=1 Tax=Candidatus Vogelbacteria bacterium CG10_big_fil_rev_8_21_14_0_10_51_16 TaxID=1975045 RepID=A0A2H0RF84_9BACT|nr:MAG: hypothetical protein COV10_00630 [Candidatus Vogelbacteria bacterium CG10_big_fil_rev_8_21_14_0_10_51_16]